MNGERQWGHSSDLVDEAAQGFGLLDAHFQDLATDLLKVVRCELIQVARECLLLRLLLRIIRAGLPDLCGQVPGFMNRAQNYRSD